MKRLADIPLSVFDLSATIRDGSSRRFLPAHRGLAQHTKATGFNW